ncbi:MAG: hypothetical protein ACRC5R_00305 [Mycoplasmatales bacterium]
MSITLNKLNKTNINHNISNLINNDINEGMREVNNKNHELIKLLAKNGYNKEIKKIQATTKNLIKQNQLMQILGEKNDII